MEDRSDKAIGWIPGAKGGRSPPDKPCLFGTFGRLWRHNAAAITFPKDWIAKSKGKFDSRLGPSLPLRMTYARQ